MSLTLDGHHLRCDGDGCREAAAAPVALHPLLSLGAVGGARLSHLGWLFVTAGATCRHYCRDCAPRYLAGLGDDLSHSRPG